MPQEKSSIEFVTSVAFVWAEQVHHNMHDLLRISVQKTHHGNEKLLPALFHGRRKKVKCLRLAIDLQNNQ